MNLYLRFFLMLIKSFFLPKLKFDEASHTSFHCLPNDLDFNGHMNNGRYLTLMDLGRLDLSIRCGFLKLMLKHNWRPVVASETIRFRRPLFLFQKFQIKTRFIGWDEEWLYIEQVFMAKKQIIAVGYVKAVVLHKNAKVHSQKVATELGMALTGNSKNLPEFLQQWQKAELDSKDSYQQLAFHL